MMSSSNHCVWPISTGRVLPIVSAFGRRAYWKEYTRPCTHASNWYLQFAGTSSAIILPLTPAPDYKVIAVKQFTHAADRVIVELPGGVREEDEGFLAAAERELGDETGYVADDIRFLGDMWPDPHNFAVCQKLLVATGCRHVPGRQRLEPEEALEPLEIALEDWLRMIFQGDVTDAKSVVATFLALRKLNTLGYNIPDLLVGAWAQMSEDDDANTEGGR